MAIETINYSFVVPFKNFMPGTIIESKQFNDNMFDMEVIINDIIEIYNENFNNIKDHIDDKNNPHEVTANQVGAYSTSEVDNFIVDLKEGNFNDNAITNRVLADECVDSRVIADKSISPTKVTDSFGDMIDISGNTDITSRYTKEEVEELLLQKVGEGTYSKEQIDELLRQIQAGEILVNSITIDKLHATVGSQLNISKNISITERPTRVETIELIRTNGVARDWGSITDDSEDNPPIPEPVTMTLPVANHMVAGTFTTPSTQILNVKIKEVVDSRGEYEELPTRMDIIESAISNIIEMFREVSVDE